MTVTGRLEISAQDHRQSAALLREVQIDLPVTGPAGRLLAALALCALALTAAMLASLVWVVVGRAVKLAAIGVAGGMLLCLAMLWWR